jgi:hypothetical protein
VETYRLMGELAAGLGDAGQTATFFERLLALEPAATWPPGTSPKILGPVALARQRLAGRRLRVHVERGEPFGARLIVDEDPLGMVAGGRARCVASGSISEARRGSEPALELVLAGPCARIEVSALDDHGNALSRFEVTSTAVNLAVRPGGAIATRPSSPPPRVLPAWYGRWQPWAVASAVCAAAGLTFGILSSQAQADLDTLNRRSPGHEFTEARAIESRGRWTALAANVSFAAAGGSGLLASFLLLRDAGRPTESAGLGVVVAGRF